MSDQTPALNRLSILGLLADLSDELAKSDDYAHLFVVGGAAMALAYDQRRTTTDIDATFAPAWMVRQVAARVALNHHLHANWLNNGVAVYLPGPDPDAVTVYETAWLKVDVASPEYLLALKLHSARPGRDLPDAARLWRIIGFTTPLQGLELLRATFDAELIEPRHIEAVMTVLDLAAQSDQASTVMARFQPPIAQQPPEPGTSM